ncbi:uncharacterized protein LOC142653090 [Rhinoderma darwinii]|uniref:uncharacterized protein LOC142653090 n=1 Tax=Rhinoderma darwinii TaxID=43563 RepID=UPI003F6708AA
MADRRVIEVSGLPGRLYDEDFVRDQLLMYFLRPRHGGGCDVTVNYPTQEEGEALLVFEDEKVAERFLSRKHTLEIGDSAHPLEMRRPQPRASQFSMPVKTSLNLSYFSNVAEVKKLLERHQISTYHESSSRLSIIGDFCDMKRCRLDLYKILRSQKPVDLRSEEKGRRAPQNDTPTLDPQSPSSSSPSRRQPEGRGHLAQDNVTRHHKDRLSGSTQHLSPTTSPQGSPSRVRAPTPTRGQKVPNSKSLSHSFAVDPSVHRYILTFEEETIKNILRPYVEMNDKYCEGFASITLTSLAPEQPERFKKACDEMTEIFHHYQNHLRADNIQLPTSPRFSNEEISAAIRRYLLKRRICSFPMADRSLLVIGMSGAILNFIQAWKGSGGRMAESIIAEALGPGASSVGVESRHSASNSKYPTQPGGSEGRGRGREAGHDAHVRGREKKQDVAGSARGKPSAKERQEPWK